MHYLASNDVTELDALVASNLPYWGVWPPELTGLHQFRDTE